MSHSVVIIERDRWLGDTYRVALSAVADVRLAHDAQTAIDLLDDSPAEILIMDLLIGSHDGLEVLHEIRSYEDWLTIPIIIVTNIELSRFPLSKADWRRYGVVAVLAKRTLTPAKLRHLVADALKDQRWTVTA